jgi:hypothetical protein
VPAGGVRSQFRRVAAAVGLDAIVEPDHVDDQGVSDVISFMDMGLQLIMSKLGHTLRLTGYSIRRTTGTKLLNSLGSERAQKYLGQHAGSRTLHEVYDQGTALLDLVSALHEDEDGAGTAPNLLLPYLTAGLNPSLKSGAPLDKDIVLANPELLQLVGDIDLLEMCIQNHSDAWMESDSFKLELGVMPWESEEVLWSTRLRTCRPTSCPNKAYFCLLMLVQPLVEIEVGASVITLTCTPIPCPSPASRLRVLRPQPPWGLGLSTTRGGHQSGFKGESPCHFG